MSGPRALRPLLWAALCAALLGLGGCGGLARGPVEPPDYYPDRTTPAETMRTFLWAWKQGDVTVLDQVLGMWLHKELSELIKKQGVEAVGDYYRKGAEDLAVLDYEWKKEGDEIHYLRIVLATKPVQRLELDFALYRFPLGWVVTGQKLVPRSIR